MEWIKILVVLYAICVIKCSGMSKSEIEDFADFLHKTSRLDQTLKKGTNPDDDYDEDEPISDHAWEDSGKFEGDLILNDRQRRLIVEDVAEGLSRNGLRDGTKRWPDNEVIYYIQKEHFSADQRQAIEDGINDIAQASCVKFRPYKKGDRDAVVIQGSRRGCFSQVGYQGGYQVLNLNARHPAGRGCFRHGTVVHELLHTLGFYHMQSSPDRDDYVDIVWGNIAQQAQNNFRKYNTFSVSDFGVGYDYDSVLHYSRRAFSINGRDTIIPKKSGVQIGQRVGLSDKDTEKLNRMYCDANSNDAQEETTQKTITKKKKPKNKPFEGHGIGYHQGKAVAIKIAPAAQTYRLSDIPFHMFDHFSKAPQAVPTPKIEELGKRVEYGYKQQTPLDDASPGKINQNEVPTAQVNKESSETDSNFRHSYETSNDNFPSEKIGSDYDSLGNIMKTYANPSYLSNYNDYKAHTDYSDFYPQRRSDKLKEEVHVPTSSAEVDENLNKKISPAILAAQFIEKLYSSTDKFDTQEGKEDSEFETKENDDSKSLDGVDTFSKESYRTAFPKKLYNLDEQIPSPEYVKPANLRNRHDYRRLYQEKQKDMDNTDKKYKIFGETVPLNEDWYKNYQEEFKPYDDKHHDPEVKASLQNSNTENKKQPYTLFGYPVPLIESWYSHR